MRLSRKIQKLFSSEIFASAWENAGRWTHPINTKSILATIDRDQLAKLRAQSPHRRDARKINAFENAEYWVGVNVKRVQDLWLDRTPPLRILDLGCGPGYFLYISGMFGHSGIGLDQDEEPLFRAMTEFFKVRRVISRIDRQAPLPDLGEKFDLVTAHRVCFHRISRSPNGDWNEWDPTDWRFFIHDIRTRFLKPEGRLFLEFNPRRDGSSFFTPELRHCFLAEGARIFRSKVLFAADPTQRARFKQRACSGGL